MAGKVVLKTIGLLSDGLGIWGFTEGLIPGESDGKSVYRIATGLDGTDGLSNAGGTIEDIRILNTNNELIGVGDAGGIEDGTHKDASVEHDKGQQGVTTQFSAGDDAICIAYITATWFDGSSWGWTGDWGKICGGLSDYPSGIDLPGEDGETDNPRCMWIDKNHDPTDVGVISIHWAAFKGNKVNGDEAKLCGSHLGFGAWADGDSDENLAVNPDAKKKSRGARKRNLIDGVEYPGRMDERLVVSDKASESHNATSVCADPFNYGPDFVSLREGRYCDMETRQMLPLCGTDGDTGDECFDLDATIGNSPAKRAIGRYGRDLGTSHSKTPTVIVDWTSK